ncbi:MAG: SpoIIE family protein phosphatase [Clostridia bacterium]|nr:SpoIIE family protein phosphatase [Clostridia bacterium]
MTQQTKRRQRMGEQALSALLGGVFTLARPAPGMQPLGLAWLAVGGHPLPAAAGVFAAGLLGGREGLIYGAAAMVVLACRAVLEGTATARRKAFFPLCAAAALGCVKGVVVLAEGFRAGALLLCETLLCLGFAMLLGESRDDRSPLQLWGQLAAFLAGLLALLPVTLWGAFSPARGVGVFGVLLAGAFGGGTVGACVGALLGAALDVAQGQGPLLTLVWSLTGLSAGLGGRRERLPAALWGCGACGLMSLWLYSLPGVGAGVTECFLAAGALVLLPEKWLLRPGAAFAGAGAGLEQGRRAAGGGQTLRSLSEAVAQLGAAMESLRCGEGTGETDLGQVYRTACESACRTCKRKELCWQEGYNDLQRMLGDLAQPLRRDHGIETHQLPAWFSAQCIRPQRFCGAVNDAYRTALRRQALQKQENRLQDIMGRQYRSLGSLLEELACRAGTGPEYDAVLESRVRRVVRAYLPRAKTAVCLHSGRLYIDLQVQRDGPEVSGDHSAMVRSLEGALGVKLLPPAVMDGGAGALLRIRQQETLCLRTFSAVRKKAGETDCGDRHLTLHTDDGRGVLLLSDGMGTGARAGQMSLQALELVRSFLQSGCGLAESTAAVLPVLSARFSEWGFVTLDLCEVSLFTGRATLLKYGAAPGFLIREGRLTRLDARALPAGLEPMEGEAPTLLLRLRPGDRLVLLSDGVWESGVTEPLLREHSGLEGQTLANLLVEESAHRGAGDDMTVLVADLLDA